MLHKIKHKESRLKSMIHKKRHNNLNEINTFQKQTHGLIVKSIHN
jgi:hypothetical protein